MRTRLIPLVTASMLAIAACGGGGSGPQGEVADLFVEVAEEEGLELDRGCVEDTTAKLSDDDAQAIVDAGPQGNPEISDEGDAIGDEVFQCVDADSFVDSIVTEMEGEGVDTDCLREELGKLDGIEGIESGMFDAMLECALDG